MAGATFLWLVKPCHNQTDPLPVAGYRELNVARYGSVGAHGQYVPVHDTDHHVRNNPRILEYFTATAKPKKRDWTEHNSWCSAFVNWCMRQSGVVGTHSAMARSWLHWHGGEVLDEPRIGAVVVFPRPPDPDQGHVAMIWGIRARGAFDVLGGNQGGHAANAAHHTDAVSSHVSNRPQSGGHGVGLPLAEGVFASGRGNPDHCGTGAGYEHADHARHCRALCRT
jgi:uncharacterized protein (TIGR02594 family)